MDLESPKGDKIVVAIVIFAVLMLIAQIVRYLIKN